MLLFIYLFSNLSCSSFNIFDVSLVDLVGRAAERGDLSRWPLKCQWDTSSARVGHVKDTASKNPTVRGLERCYCYLESNMSDFFREVNNSNSPPGKKHSVHVFNVSVHGLSIYRANVFLFNIFCPFVKQIL